MRLNVVRSANAASLYVIESTYVAGKHSSRIVEKLGTEAALCEKLGGEDPYAWARNYITQLNQQEKEGTRVVKVEFDPNKQIPLNQTTWFNVGYLFLQSIYHGLKLDKLCKEISESHNYQYNLSDILSRLIYTRILHPSSKLSSYEESKRFLEPVSFSLEDVYRALDVLADESERIQAHAYETSKDLADRRSAILYYDCTNYYFETEEEEGIRQYGHSKEHRPNPIISMGLFMDGNGMPLAFDLNPGAMNEQATLKPVQERMIKDFSLSRVVVCTDAGLGSMKNRLLNDTPNRAFVVTQSIKKLEKSLKEWALSPTGWKIPGDVNTYDVSEIDDTSENKTVYYKRKKIRTEGKDENGKQAILEQDLIVTYSPKYKAYQREVRSRQVERAKQMVKTPNKQRNVRQNDPARFIDDVRLTKEGEVATKRAVSLNISAIAEEERYDGFYGVCTNLDDEIETILKINKGRWEIEESFRILKTDFRARPVYLSREQRIRAHFLTCFLSLLVYRILEKRLSEEYTANEIIRTLKNMDLHEVVNGEGYTPSYTRTALTDALHEAFGFRTDMQFITKKKMKAIQAKTKNTRALLKNPGV
jgi:transposase